MANLIGNGNDVPFGNAPIFDKLSDAVDYAVELMKAEDRAFAARCGDEIDVETKSYEDVEATVWKILAHGENEDEYDVSWVVLPGQQDGTWATIGAARNADAWFEDEWSDSFYKDIVDELNAGLEEEGEIEAPEEGVDDGWGDATRDKAPTRSGGGR